MYRGFSAESAQSFPKLRNRIVKPVLKIDKSVRRPKSIAKLLGRDNRAGILEKNIENADSLRLNTDF